MYLTIQSLNEVLSFIGLFHRANIGFLIHLALLI